MHVRRCAHCLQSEEAACKIISPGRWGRKTEYAELAGRTGMKPHLTRRNTGSTRTDKTAGAVVKDFRKAISRPKIDPACRSARCVWSEGSVKGCFRPIGPGSKCTGVI